MQTYNITLIQGSSYNLNLNVSNSDNSYFNLSGHNCRGGLKYKYSDTGYLLNFNPTITNYESGAINIYLSGSQTQTLPVFIGVYDIETYSSGGYVNKFIKGYCECAPEVSTLD